MKILILTDYFPPQKGGFSRYVYEISKGWINHGENVIIVSTLIYDNKKSYYHNSTADRLIFIEKKGGGYFNNLIIFLKFLPVYFSFKPDFVFLPTWYRYSMPLVLLYFFTGKNIKYVIGCHAADILGLHIGSSLKTNNFFKYLGKLALKHATGLFAISKYTAKELKKLGISKNKIKVFPNGVDSRIFRPQRVNKRGLLSKYGIKNPDYKLLLTVAQLNIRKGIDTGINLVYELKKDNIFVNYVVIGNGDDEQRLRNKISQFNLSEQVYILTTVDDIELINFYNICDVFLLLSRHEGDLNVEGFGISILEASACEKPVIVGNSGGIPDAVENGKSGYLVDPYDLNGIKNKTVYLLNNTEKSVSMGKYGRKRTVEVYNWRIITKNMIHVLNNLFKNNKS